MCICRLHCGEYVKVLRVCVVYNTGVRRAFHYFSLLFYGGRRFAYNACDPCGCTSRNRVGVFGLIDVSMWDRCARSMQVSCIIPADRQISCIIPADRQVSCIIPADRQVSCIIPADRQVSCIIRLLDRSILIRD